MYLDESLNFSYHVKDKMPQAMKVMGVIKELSKTFSQHFLISIYKSFVRPQFDYGDIIYEQPNNKSLN